MDFILNDYHRNTQNDDLLEDVKTVSKHIGKNTVTIEQYNEYGKYHASTLQRRFGSWFKVLELANLEPSRSKLNNSENDLFKNIESVWILLGRQPKYYEMKKPLSKYSAGTYENKYGSWRNALEQFIKYLNNNIEDTEEINYDEIKENEIIQNEVKHKTKRDISERMRFRVLMRDGFTCKKCGRSPTREMGVELHVDHIIPWSKGGETILENLETKCQECNLGKGNAFDV
jgi:hypothetical protein